MFVWFVLRSSLILALSNWAFLGGINSGFLSRLPNSSFFSLHFYLLSLHFYFTSNFVNLSAFAYSASWRDEIQEMPPFLAKSKVTLRDGSRRSGEETLFSLTFSIFPAWYQGFIPKYLSQRTQSSLRDKVKPSTTALFSLLFSLAIDSFPTR